MMVSKDLKAFWKEIEHLSYASAVWGYPDNKMVERLKKYGLKFTCPCCDKVY